MLTTIKKGTACLTFDLICILAFIVQKSLWVKFKIQHPVLQSSPDSYWVLSFQSTIPQHYRLAVIQHPSSSMYKRLSTINDPNLKPLNFKP